MTDEMDEEPRGRRSRKKQSPSQPAGIRAWASAALGALVLVLCGFMLGLGLGVLSEEPQMVASHLAGGSEEVTLVGAVADTAGDSEVSEEEELVVDRASAEPAWVPPVPRAEELPKSTARSERVAAARTKPAAPAVSAAPPPVSAAPVPAAPGGGWAIQVGAFSRSSSADALAESLIAKGFQTYLKPSADSADGRWRVRVGPLPTQREAQQMARRLEREESLSTWVLSEGGG